MRDREDADIRSDENAVADSDLSLVEDRQPVVGDQVVADSDVEPEVASKRAVDKRAASGLSADFAQKPLALRSVVWCDLVKSVSF